MSVPGQSRQDSGVKTIFPKSLHGNGYDYLLPFCASPGATPNPS